MQMRAPCEAVPTAASSRPPVTTLHYLMCDFCENAKDILEMLQRSSLVQETQAACMALVNDRVSSTQAGMLRTNANFQKVMHMQNVYTMSEWQNIYDRDSTESHQLLIMAERCQCLGIVRP